MIQIFFKKSKISESDWEIVYQKILEITRSFPLQLERIESYSGYKPELDKTHYDLTVQAGTPDEHISFWGDRMSYSAKFTVKFYKNWDTQKIKGFSDDEIDVNKPVTWCTPKVFNFSGYPPNANGCKLHSGYIETEGALYQYAILAIGIMLENILPGKVFMIAFENDSDEINETIRWLEGVFSEKFDTPVYFDKCRLLETLVAHYDSKKELAGRMDMLYMNQFKKNMIFAIEHIGYTPALEYYSEVLSNAGFGTFGFSDVLNPWIAATQNLESTLQLVAKSKEMLLSDKENIRNINNAEKYDYTYILKNLLNDYILWSPEQREYLEQFPTNKQALETGEEDLFGSLLRIGGYRFDICPFFANKEQLFEAFMYHDPKNGKEYKIIIDNWIEKNKNSYNEFVEKIDKMASQAAEKLSEDDDEKEVYSKEYQLLSKIKEFSHQYAEHEQYFVIEALKRNPDFMDIGGAVERFQNDLMKLYNSDENKQNIQFIQSWTKEEKIRRIKSRIKEKGLSVNPNFEQWMEEENDPGVLTSLSMSVALKIYHRSDAFARQQVLMDRKYWNNWKQGEVFAQKE